MFKEIRLPLLSALIVFVVILLGACDVFSGAESAPSVSDDSLQIADITPAVGTDLDSAQASITIEFTHPVVENDYTRSDVEPGNGNRYLVDVIGLFPVQAKDLTPSGAVPFEIEFQDDRTQLTITTLEDLQDGFVYNLNLGNPAGNTGFYDSRFKSANGGRYVANPNLDEDLNLTYSVGLSDGQPATPSVSFADQDGDGVTIADDGELDYGDDPVTVELQVDEIDDSGAEVKGYEVYYRSQNQVGRDGDQFRKATSSQVDPVASSSEFDDSDGIIPVDAAFEGSGPLGFEVTVGDFPLAANDGSYGPIEWKVRAVSVNNVRGDFSSVLTTGDNTLPELAFATGGEENEDGDLLSILVVFSENLDDGTVSADRFRVIDGGGSEIDLSEAVLENRPPSDGLSVVELFLSSATPSGDVDHVEVDDADTSDPVTDLAGNGVDPDNSVYP